MFAQFVFMRLKPNGGGEFARAIENETIPTLRKLRGFQDQITFIESDGPEAVAITLWDNKEDSDAYTRGNDSQMLKSLAKVTEGTPQIRTYEVSTSTFHKVAPPVDDLKKGVLCLARL
jgi:heme-degrading monooxygenase HmoA